MNMNPTKRTRIALWIGLFLLFSFVVSSDSIWDYLTEGRANQLYCRLYGDCVVSNLTVLGGYFNVSVNNYNVTGSIQATGNIFASYYYGNGTFLNSLLCSNLYGGTDNDYCSDLDTDTYNTSSEMIAAANSSGLIVNWSNIITGGGNTSAEMIAALTPYILENNNSLLYYLTTNNNSVNSYWLNNNASLTSYILYVNSTNGEGGVGGSDGLGNHTAFMNLNMSGYNITEVEYIKFKDGTITNGSWTWFP